MISVIITSKNEPETIEMAILAFLAEDYLNNAFEILAIAPDKATLRAIEAINDARVRCLADKGLGKPAALNIGIRHSRGHILIFSDGDVVIQKGSVRFLLLSLKNGAVCARPILASAAKISRYVFWQECLFNYAHNLRLKRNAQADFIALNGYLFAITKKTLKNFQFADNLLAEDEYLSYYLWRNKYQLQYVPNAAVIVKPPLNYKDWLAQKVRTLGGASQVPSAWKKAVAMRSFLKESSQAFYFIKNYGSTVQEKYWLFLLLLARLHAWIKSFYLIKIRRKSAQSLWIRISSTK